MACNLGFGIYVSDIVKQFVGSLNNNIRKFNRPIFCDFKVDNVFDLNFDFVRKLHNEIKKNNITCNLISWNWALPANHNFPNSADLRYLWNCSNDVLVRSYVFWIIIVWGADFSKPVIQNHMHNNVKLIGLKKY